MPYILYGATTAAWLGLTAGVLIPAVFPARTPPIGGVALAAVAALALTILCCTRYLRKGMSEEAAKFAKTALPVNEAFRYGAEYVQARSAAGLPTWLPRQAALPSAPTADGTETVELPRIGGAVVPFPQGRTRPPRPGRNN